MDDFEKLQRKQSRTFILVFINFCLFMVLFAGLGYLSWQSITLVNRLQGNLDRAEQTIAQLQSRFQQVDVNMIVDQLVTTASKQLSDSIKEVVQDSNISNPIVQASEKLTATHEMIEQTGQAIQGINTRIEKLNNEEIAKLVSYHILKSLGDGFQEAAETQKAEPINDQ